MAVSGNQCQSLTISGNQWQSVASVAISGNQCQSLTLSHNHWSSLAITGNHWQPVATSGNQWQSVAISGNQWQPVASPCPNPQYNVHVEASPVLQNGRDSTATDCRFAARRYQQLRPDLVKALQVDEYAKLRSDY